MAARPDVEDGASGGNRTPVCSLEGCRSTIELHSQSQYSDATGASRRSFIGLLFPGGQAIGLAEEKNGGGSRIRTCEGRTIRFTV